MLINRFEAKRINGPWLRHTFHLDLFAYCIWSCVSSWGRSPTLAHSGYILVHSLFWLTGEPNSEPRPHLWPTRNSGQNSRSVHHRGGISPLLAPSITFTNPFNDLSNGALLCPRQSSGFHSECVVSIEMNCVCPTLCISCIHFHSRVKRSARTPPDCPP